MWQETTGSSVIGVVSLRALHSFNLFNVIYWEDLFSWVYSSISAYRRKEQVYSIILSTYGACWTVICRSFWLSRCGGCWRATPGRWLTSWLPARTAINKALLRCETTWGHWQVCSVFSHLNISYCWKLPQVSVCCILWNGATYGRKILHADKHADMSTKLMSIGVIVGKKMKFV